MTIQNDALLRDASGEPIPHQMWDEVWSRYVPYKVPFLTAVAMGLVPGYKRASAIGYNASIDTATVPEDVWEGGGLFPWINTPTQCQVRSTSALDTAAGTGLRSVEVAALDSTGAEATVVVALNGTTPVQLPALITASNGMRGMSVGSLENNQGDIILEDTSGAQLRGIMKAGEGASHQAPYTVPTGYQFILPQMVIDISNPTGAAAQFVQMRTYFRAGPTAVARNTLILGASTYVPYPHMIDPPIVLPAGFRFSMRVTSVSANGVIVTAGWNGALRQVTPP